MADFSELNDYLSDVTTDVRREATITLCSNMAMVGDEQLQPDVERLLMSSTVGEAPAVLDDLTRLLFDHLYVMTLNMGIVWIDDISYDNLFEMADVLDGLLLIDDTEDTGEIKAILSKDQSNEEVLVDVLTYALNKDMLGVLDLLNHVDDGFIRGLETLTKNVSKENEIDTVAHKTGEYIKNRLTAAVTTMHQGLAYLYIMSGGALGVDVDSLLQLHEEELVSITDQRVLIEEIKGFLLASNVEDDKLYNEAVRLVNRWVNDDSVLLGSAKQLEVLKQ
ncbi:putative anti-crispr protein [Proteus phage 10]|nr:putative anti-crispr protein [Proteus phage 10]